MKEATGELSTTVIAIVAIAAIAAVFTAFLLPNLRAQIALNQACSGGPGYQTDNICCTGGTVNCSTNGTNSKTCRNGNTMTGEADTYQCFYTP